VGKSCVDFLPAKLNRRVELQAVTQTPDGQGGFTEAWVTAATLWAAIDPVKGYERYQAHQVQTPVSHKVTIRYRSGVTTKKRFLFGSRVFEIKEVLNQNEANEFLVIRALEQQ